MILIGVKHIEYPSFVYAKNAQDIDKTKSKDIIVIEQDNTKLAKFCQINDIAYSSTITSIKNAIILENLDIKYLFCHNAISKTIQNIADNYVFDSKILEIIDNECKIESVALNGIDGAIIKHVLT